MRGTLDSKKQFISWVKKNNPKLYRAAIVQNNQGLLSADKPTEKGWLDKLTESITSLAPKYLQYKQQKKVMRMQMKRAEAGLPPANVADYAPVIKTKIDIGEETRKSLMKDTGKMLMPYALGAGGLLLLFVVLQAKK